MAAGAELPLRCRPLLQPPRGEIHAMEEAEQTDGDIKTTVLTNMPIEEGFDEHILPHDFAVFTNSDGNLTIDTVEHVEVVEQAGPPEAEVAKTTVYITQVGEPAEDMEGEYEEYELYDEEEEEEDEEEEDSLVDDPTFEIGKESKDDEAFECGTCNRTFKTPAVGSCHKGALFL